jgi:hypothetical protein
MPDRRQKLILADHSVTAADQVNKKIEDLGLEGHGHCTPPQLAAIHVERIFLKQIAQCFFPFFVASVATLAQAPKGKMEGTLSQN